MAFIDVTSRGCTLDQELLAFARGEALDVGAEWDGVARIAVAIESSDELARVTRCWVRVTVATVDDVVSVNELCARASSCAWPNGALTLAVARAFAAIRVRLARTPSVRPSALAAE